MIFDSIKTLRKHFYQASLERYRIKSAFSKIPDGSFSRQHVKHV